MVVEANAASVALMRDGRVLMIQRRRQPFAGLWTFPGGRCEPGEAAVSAAKREVREELGLELAELAPLTELTTEGWRLAVFRSHSFTGEVVADTAEIAALRWCTFAEACALPGTPGLGEVLRRAFAVA